MIGNIEEMPFYDERFIYYGDDKVYYHHWMNLMGFKYFVLPDHFITHLWHKQSPWSKKERQITKM